MPGQIVMPRRALTMATGNVVRWLKQEGESIAEGEPLLEIETDKAAVEIEALEAGTLHQMVAGVGEEVPVGGVIAYFLKPGETVPAGTEVGVPAKVMNMPRSSQADGSVTGVVAVASSLQKVKASPAARRLAKDQGISLPEVRGSGP